MPSILALLSHIKGLMALVWLYVLLLVVCWSLGSCCMFRCGAENSLVPLSGQDQLPVTRLPCEQVAPSRHFRSFLLGKREFEAKKKQQREGIQWSSATADFVIPQQGVMNKFSSTENQIRTGIRLHKGNWLKLSIAVGG